MVVFETKKASGTRNLGRQFCQAWLGEASSFTTLLHSNVVGKLGKVKGALVIGLTGDLGSGKTTFVKGLAKGLGIKETITSPTYVFCRSYPFGQGRMFYHLDLYRIDKQPRGQVLSSFNFEEIIKNSSNVVAIEWAERLERTVLKNSLRVIFDYAHRGRKIKVF